MKGTFFSFQNYTWSFITFVENRQQIKKFRGGKGVYKLNLKQNSYQTRPKFFVPSKGFNSSKNLENIFKHPVFLNHEATHWGSMLKILVSRCTPVYMLILTSSKTKRAQVPCSWHIAAYTASPWQPLQLNLSSNYPFELHMELHHLLAVLMFYQVIRSCQSDNNRNPNTKL